MTTQNTSQEGKLPHLRVQQATEVALANEGWQTPAPAGNFALFSGTYGLYGPCPQLRAAFPDRPLELTGHRHMSTPEDSTKTTDRQPWQSGQPPHLRAQSPPHISFHGTARPIPAPAGQTVSGSLVRRLRRANPRTCESNQRLPAGIHLVEGQSPHLRAALPGLALTVPTPRHTPAPAERLSRGRGASSRGPDSPGPAPAGPAARRRSGPRRSVRETSRRTAGRPRIYRPGRRSRAGPGFR